MAKKQKIELREVKVKGTEGIYESLYPGNKLKLSRYSILSLVPKNLFEQFQRTSNIWFLIVSIFQLIPFQLNPTDSWTTIVPLSILLVLTLIKDAYCDRWLWKKDEIFNNLIYPCWDGEKFVNQKSENILVGQFIMIKENQTIPADIIIVSSQKQGSIFLDMSQLVGFTSLARKVPVDRFAKILNMEHEILQMGKIQGKLMLAEPTSDYSVFSGSFKFDKIPGAIDIDVKNVLFRGGILKGESLIIGLVAYCGKETKIQMNTFPLQRKQSKLEKTVNKWVIYILLVLVIVVFLSVIGFYYIGLDNISNYTVLEPLITFTLLYNNIVPISLFMVIDIIRLAQNYFFSRNFKGIVFNNETVNENLGQVDFLLTDKVGTLTSNHLLLKTCIIGEKKYEESYNLSSLRQDIEPAFDTNTYLVGTSARQHLGSTISTFPELKNELIDESMYSNIWLFIRCIAMSNSLFQRNSVFYGSHDEVALVKACKDLGVIVNIPSNNLIELTHEPSGSKSYYRIVANRPFTNEKRKSRSIIEEAEGTGVLYVKGAADAMLPLLNISDNSLYDIKNNLKEMKERGLRTMILAYKKITPDNLLETKSKIQRLKKSLLNPESRIEAMFKEMEKNMKFLGITGMSEEMLPGSVETLTQLKKAGMKIWMVSSDTLTNTLLVAKQTEIIEPDSKVVELVGINTENSCTKVLIKAAKSLIFKQGGINIVPSGGEIEVRRRSRIGEESTLFSESDTLIERSMQELSNKLIHRKNSDLENELNLILARSFEPSELDYSVVIDRKTFLVALKDLDSRKLLVCLLICAKSACFVDLMPIDKGNVVKLLKENTKFKPLVASIGSGEGDISMLQTSDVGIAINYGDDSLLHNYSDVVIRKFTELSILLLGQGHWNYTRLSKAILLYLYKNCFLTLVTLAYTFLCNFSGTSVFNASLLIGFNLFFTSLPILVIGIFDQDLPYEKIESHPQIYTIGIQDMAFNIKNLLRYLGMGIFQGVILVILVFVGYPNILTIFGGTEDLISLGTVIYITLVGSVLLQIYIETYCYSLLYYTSQFLSVVFLIIFICIVGETKFPNDELLGIGYFLQTSPISLINIFFTSLFCVVPSYILYNCIEFFGTRQFNKYKSSFALNMLFVDKLEKFKNALGDLYVNTSNWKSKVQDEKFAMSKITLKFVFAHIEKKFTENFIRSNLKLFKWTIAFLWLLVILWTVFGALLMEVSMDYTLARIVISAACSLMLFLLWTEHFLKNYKFYILLLIFITLLTKFTLEITFSKTSILATALVPSVTFLILNVGWFYILVLNILNITLFVISISTEYSLVYNPEDAALLAATNIVFVLAISLTSAVAGYFLEISRRIQDKLHNKAHRGVEKIQSILSIMLPPFVRNRVKEGVRYIADDQGEVTILFCDICDFDSICKEYTPPEISTFLDQLFSSFDALCENAGVTKIETVGKTYMACAGLKDSDKDLPQHLRRQPHARRTIELGFAMIQEVNSIQLKNGSTLQVKIGINSGHVAAGVVGYHKPQFSLVGDTVNTASRMCSTLDSPNSIQISSNTYQILRLYTDLEFTPRLVYAKGKGNIEVYKVHEAKPDNSDIAGGFGSSNFGTNMNMISHSTFFPEAQSEEDKKSEIKRLARSSKIMDSEFLKRKDSNLIQYNPLMSISCRELEPEKEFRLKKLTDNYYSIMQALLIAACAIFLMTIFSICEWSVINDYTTTALIILRGIVTGYLIIILSLHSRIYSKRYYPYLIISCLVLMICIVMLHIRADIHFPADIIGLEIMYIIIILNHASAASFPMVIFVNIFIFIPWIALAINTNDQSLHLTNALLVAGFSIINFKAIYTQERNDRANYNLNWLADKEIKDNEALLIQMMPAHVLDNLEKGRSVTDRLMQVTLIFADIVGFTDWSSSKKPEEIVRMLSNLFTRFDKLCVELDVYKVHTIGDCYVVMGHVRRQKRDPSKECLNVMKMAYRMIEVIKEENVKHSSNLNMRIGVHTGEIIAGVIGTNIVRYDIWGPDVLIANKMESNGCIGRVKCSEDTKVMIESRSREGFVLGFWELGGCGGIWGFVFEESNKIEVPAIGVVKQSFYVDCVNLDALDVIE
ncbi:hypothetical protein SteCoe_21934 [Stentor coeruleus]|uniref:Guanylate cyclase domain-containing protein n=1 Tax=Stentor coeruleus TaxID=5963 RepID=A0A1R2BNN4_9CILI|nr:hypothetical protein SteCoe_21934 [Stentor coeruleus]